MCKSLQSFFQTYTNFWSIYFILFYMCKRSYEVSNAVNSRVAVPFAFDWPPGRYDFLLVFCNGQGRRSHKIIGGT